jgi:hypothetical protein
MAVAGIPYWLVRCWLSAFTTTSSTSAAGTRVRFPAGFVHRLGAEVIQLFEFPMLDFASREQFDIDIFEAADQSIKNGRR